MRHHNATGRATSKLLNSRRLEMVMNVTGEINKVLAKTRLASRAVVLLAVFAVSRPGLAQQAASTFPMQFSVEQHELQRVPAQFKFQSRISQARIAVGDAVLRNLSVKLMHGSTELCSQSFAPTRARNSVLNLTIDALACSNGLSVDENIAKHTRLGFQLCIGESCLKPVELGTVPYSVKSSFAYTAEQTHRAEVAAQAHYAHRVSADREMLVGGSQGTGYFDFYTPPASEIYTDYTPHLTDGFLSWVPLSTGTEHPRRLNVCARDADDQLVPLAELGIHADYTVMRGNAAVAGALEVVSGGLYVGPGAGLSGSGFEMKVESEASFTGDVLLGDGAVGVNDNPELAVCVPSSFTGPVSVTGATMRVSGGDLLVGDMAASVSDEPELVVATSAVFDGQVSLPSQAVLIGSEASATSGTGSELVVSSPTRLSGSVRIEQGDLLVGTGATGVNPMGQEVVVAAPTEFQDTVVASGGNVRMQGGDLLVGAGAHGYLSAAELVVDGQASFKQHVNFEQSVSFEGSVTLPSNIDVAATDVTCSECVSRTEMGLGRQVHVVSNNGSPSADEAVESALFCVAFHEHGPAGRAFLPLNNKKTIPPSWLGMSTPADCSGVGDYAFVRLRFDEDGFGLTVVDGTWEGCGEEGVERAMGLDLAATAICVQ